MKKIGLYIHIPFCKSKCTYCAFTSFHRDDAVMHAYIDALCGEIERELSGNIIVDTLYIGGGTPSILHSRDIARIIDTVRSTAIWQPREVTVECNPESITREKLVEYQSAGITRISMGVQSLNDNILKIIGRIHTSNIAIEKARMCVGLGFNTSVDMILGLPSSTSEDIYRFVDTFASIGVQHISSYSLSVEKGTRLESMVKGGKVVLPTEDETIDQYEYAYELLKEQGYARYEVSNFSKSGYESLHNNKYWQMDEYIGVGVASHSYFNGKRYYNTKDLDDYIARSNRGESTRTIDEILTKEDLLEETLMLGLRLEKGVAIKRLDALCGGDFISIYRANLDKVKPCIEMNNGTIKIRPEYMNVMNTIIVDILYKG